MFLYYLHIAIKSIRSTPAVSAITIAAIGLGIAVSTSMISLYHIMAQDPIPSKSERIFNVRLDSWEMGSELFSVKPGEPPKQITWQDMDRIRQSDLPKHYSAVINAAVYTFPEKDQGQPFQASVTLCHQGFFPMFRVPFSFGNAWSSSEEADNESVVVLSHEANQKLFGGQDSVGRSLRLDEMSYTVVGVMAPWTPMPNFYDVINNPFSKPNEIFMPVGLYRDRARNLAATGNSDSWGRGSSEPGFLFTGSERCWIQYWVELDLKDRAAYANYLDNYTEEQKALGRFPKPINNRVQPLMSWLEQREVAPPQTLALVVIALLFLLVCALNLMGLLLGKFYARSGLVGIHRALGAPRMAIFLQHILECKLVGLIGGCLGMVAAVFFLGLIGRLLPADAFNPESLRLDGFMIMVALGLSLLASLVAGAYPAWRACRLSPAVQVKIQ